MIKEVYNNSVNAFIEYPVDKAVTALNKAGFFTRSSGFHSHFDEKRFGLKPCWCIIVEGTVPAELKVLANKNSLQTMERYPLKGVKKWLMTIIYLPDEIAGERNCWKAKTIFERFAKEINGRRSYKRAA